MTLQAPEIKGSEEVMVIVRVTVTNYQGNSDLAATQEHNILQFKLMGFTETHYFLD